MAYNALIYIYIDIHSRMNMSCRLSITNTMSLSLLGACGRGAWLGTPTQARRLMKKPHVLCRLLLLSRDHLLLGIQSQKFLHQVPTWLFP